MIVGSVLVVGATRGIGLEFVKQIANLSEPPKFVFASYRSEATVEELRKLAEETTRTRIILVKMDVTNLDEIKAAKEVVAMYVGKEGLNLIINNAGGQKKEEGFPNLTKEDIIFHFRVNTIGPVLVAQVFLPLLKQAAEFNKDHPRSVSRAAILIISSHGGSLTGAGLASPERDNIKVHSYRISKAAVNMAMREMSVVLDKMGILIISICPGWVKTEMGGPRANVELEDSISSMLSFFSKLSDEHHGEFFSRFGEKYEF